jgi:hypothetical protein
LVVGFYGEADGIESLAEFMTAVGRPLRGTVGVDWIAGTKALRGTFAAGRTGAYPRLEMNIRNAFLLRPKYFGMLNWGDEIAWNYYGRGEVVKSGPDAGKRRPVWNNHEYDFPVLAFHQYLRTADSAYFDEGEIAVRHMLGVDYLHAHEPWTNWVWEPEQSVNGVIMHFSEHAGCGWAPCHLWVGGILDYYLLTGNQDALRKAEAIGRSLGWNVHCRFAIEILDEKKRGEHLAREYGWPLVALSELYEVTGNDDWLAVAREYVDLLIQWRRANPMLDDTGYSIMICLVGLARVHRYTGDAAVKELFLGLLKDTRAQLYSPEGLLAYKRNERLPSGGMLGLEALGYAYELTGDLDFVSVGVRELAYVLDNGQLQLNRDEGWDRKALNSTLSRRYASVHYRPIDGQMMGYLLRHAFPFLDLADRLGMLKAVELSGPPPVIIDE